MKYSTKVSDAVHILSFIALNAKESLTSQAIAESVKTNPAFVRQMMSSLRNAGLLTSVKGHAKPALSGCEGHFPSGRVPRRRRRQAPPASGHAHKSGMRRGCQYPARHPRLLRPGAEKGRRGNGLHQHAGYPGPVRKTAGKAGTLISGARCRGLPAFPSVWQNRIMKVIVITGSYAYLFVSKRGVLHAEIKSDCFGRHFICHVCLQCFGGKRLRSDRRQYSV